MAFSAKTDYCGLLAALNPASPASPVVAIRDDAENASQQSYMPIGEKGGIIDVEVYGENAAPTNTYALKVAIDAPSGKIKLGTVTTVTTGSGAETVSKKYRLTSVKFSTAANSAVSISAASQLVEPGAANDDAKNYVVPEFELDTAHLAQDMFSAFTMTGTNANLTQLDAEAKVDCDPDTLVGDIISNGVGNALLTVSGTILVKGDVVPTVTASSGFVVTQKPTCTNPETAYKSYAFTLVRPLALYVAPSSNG